MSTAPDFMPVLSRGDHSSPAKGACFMEMESLLAGEPWSDAPACTHPVLARCAQAVNDRLSDEDRHLLVPLLGRTIGTAPTGTGHEQAVLRVRLAVWCARYVQGGVAPEEAEVVEAALATAEAWCEGKATVEQCRTAAAAATAARTTSAAAHAAAVGTTSAAAHAAAVGTTYAASAATSAAYAACAAYGRDPADPERLVGLLSGLLDEHDRLTGRKAPEVTTADLRAVATHVG